MPVIAVTKTPKVSAPTAWLWSKPSTTARLTQSLAAPSVSAAASTTSPMSSVRGSSQAPKARRAPPAAATPVGGTPSGGVRRGVAVPGRQEGADGPQRRRRG